jgi:hypothetical protein
VGRPRCCADFDYRWQLWDRELHIRLRVREAALWLEFDDSPLTQSLELIYTPCTYGGRRAWMRCPRCGGRIAIAYHRAGWFRCRQCAGLRYRSQSLGKVHRALVDRFQAKHGELRRRPKGMRRVTYRRLKARLNELYARWGRRNGRKPTKALGKDCLRRCSDLLSGT